MSFANANWMKSTHEAFLRKWEGQIMVNDPDWFERAGKNVDLYLRLRLRNMLETTRQVGQAGWTFDSHDACIFAFMYADASSCETQCIPYTGIVTGRESWWPVIVVDVPGELVPVYCPGLAWQKARPWWVHRSRVFIVATPEADN